MSAQNSSLNHIALPYASALYDLASDANAISATEKALDAVANLANKNADFARLLNSPIISADRKSAAADAILKKLKTPTLSANFIRLVAKNGRLIALPAMISTFKELAANARGEASAEITSATELSKTQLKSLADTLKKKIGKTVTLQTHVDPDLIGGLIVKVGSQMIDSSLKTKLSAMKIAMKEVG